MQFVGVDPLQAGNVVQLVLVLGLTIGWISTYIFRVSNKEMTYAQQLRDYESAVMEVSFSVSIFFFLCNTLIRLTTIKNLCLSLSTSFLLTISIDAATWVSLLRIKISLLMWAEWDVYDLWAGIFPEVS